MGGASIVDGWLHRALRPVNTTHNVDVHAEGFHMMWVAHTPKTCNQWGRICSAPHCNHWGEVWRASTLKESMDDDVELSLTIINVFPLVLLERGTRFGNREMVHSNQGSGSPLNVWGGSACDSPPIAVVYSDMTCVFVVLRKLKFCFTARLWTYMKFINVQLAKHCRY
jgi:hypothetical protein